MGWRQRQKAAGRRQLGGGNWEEAAGRRQLGGGSWDTYNHPLPTTHYHPLPTI